MRLNTIVACNLLLLLLLLLVVVAPATAAEAMKHY